MLNQFNIRMVQPSDASGIIEVYRPYVLGTAITFEYEVPDEQEIIRRIEKIIPQFPWIVIAQNNKIVGYAYGHQHRPRAAYQWSAESTIYVDSGFHRLGMARILYETLFELLKLQGYVNVYAGVVVPNIKSEKFHKALGFEELGLFRQIGFKFNIWHDTQWFQLHFQSKPKHPAPPLNLKDVMETPAFSNIMEIAQTRVSQLNKDSKDV